MKEKIFNLEISPVQKVLLSFLLLILLGTILLLMPFSTRKGISAVDALFTSTSAVCVTGLTVKDTANDFTVAGKIIILFLIQFGGLGIMTFSLALFSLMTGGVSIKWKFTFESIYSNVHKISIIGLLKRIILYTMLIELIIAVVIFTQLYSDYPLWKAIGHSVFHSVAAFCNAGFSTFSDNLVPVRDNHIIITVISLAIITGGLGFIVLNEVIKAPKKNIKLFLSQLSLHTKVVLASTALLIFLGMFVILILESNHHFSDMNVWQKMSASFFQSVTCRTAGFNTVDIGKLRDSTLSLMIVLMMIGGAPGSIAGGIKVTTITVIIALIITKFKGYNQVVLWGRALNKETIEKSTILLILSSLFIFTAVFFILAFQSFDLHNSLLATLFEVVSAFGTVGLSTGITSELTDFVKIMLCIVMYVGRLGPLTLLTALTSSKKNINIRFPEEHIMIG